MAGSTLSAKLKRRTASALFPIYDHLYQMPKWYVQFPTERKVYRGKDVTNYTNPSVLLFTTHKCASTLLNRLLEMFSEHSAMSHVDLDGYLCGWNRNRQGADHPDVLDRAYFNQGYLYGPCRSFRAVKNLDEYRPILVLRDPRDILVSRYYSMGHSHSVISPNILEARDDAREQSIDEYVLAESAIYETHFHDYLEHVYENENVDELFVTYEEMLYESADFLTRLESFLGITLPEEEQQYVLTEELELPEEEDKQSHRRSGVSGQFQEELEPETIEELNARFEAPLEAFGFA